MKLEEYLNVFYLYEEEEDCGDKVYKTLKCEIPLEENFENFEDLNDSINLQLREQTNGRDSLPDESQLCYFANKIKKDKDDQVLPTHKQINVFNGDLPVNAKYNESLKDSLDPHPEDEVELCISIPINEETKDQTLEEIIQNSDALMLSNKPDLQLLLFINND